ASNSVPGRYASTLPYLLSTPAVPPIRVATVLAGHLASLSWIASATVTTGHLNITVTDDALASLAVRIPRAPDCAASDTLRGLPVPAPLPPAEPQSWADAQSLVTADVNCRLGRKAGATNFPERLTQRSPVTQPGFPVGPASGYAGPDSLRYALLTRPRGWRPASAADLPVRYHRANPVYAVRYAHAHAASTLRQAADLGLDRGEAEQFVPRLLGHPIERALLDAMSWLPERVAWAARRGRPGEFARYTEELAGTYHDCRERCPALPFGGHSAPRDPDTIRARLWLVTAVRTTIAAGLDLLGVSAPDRL
ncbi:MAG: DALR anticodon-binding domain-containing protein, partial [Streptosporangiaceae bacterium]